MKKIIKKINTAFLRKNFKNLTFDQKTIFWGHVLTIISCFFPWILIMPIHGNSYFYNAFGGMTWLMGIVVFVASLFIIFLFAEDLWEKKWLKLSILKTTIFLFTSLQQIILLLCAWSVLESLKTNFESAEIRFGLFVCIISQIICLVASYLYSQNNKKQKVNEFFHNH